MIYFIRHGESLANVRNVFAGQKDDSELSGKGHSQAVETAMVLFHEYPKIHKVICSPLKRTIQTANIIKKYFANELGYDLEIVTDERIMEYDMGILTGTPIRPISSLEFISAPGAENPFKFQERILSFLKDLHLIYKNENILIVSHAGVGKMLEIIKEGKSPELFNDVPRVANASIQEINWIENYLNP